MQYGMGFGRGFGFRGSSPEWPYVGRGRGGRPRCMAFGLPYNPQAAEGQTTISETEMSFLKTQAQNLKQQLDSLELRIKNLEQKKEGEQV
jgi:Family of unknown function (DUF5320)